MTAVTLDEAHWRERLSALARKHGVVGASLAISSGDRVATAACGVLNIRTGQPTTPESLFQVGSISKVWTATLAMQLVDDGLLDLDAPVRRYLPDFKIADEHISATVTTRQLLSHTSGIDGDLFIDTGRGDDSLAKYVEAMAKLTQVVPPGRTMSYCNSGYSLLGHLIAVLRGKSWDEVLRERLFKPLGIDSAGTLPEEALLHGAATGHLQPPGVAEPSVTPRWGLFRSAAPAGLIHSTAAQQIAFARLHLNGGVATDGTRLLSPASVDAMRVEHIGIPDRWTLGTHWGLGWILDRWGDQAVCGHDGATLGQGAFLRVLPEADLAIVLLTNGGRAMRALYHELFTEIATALAGVAPPPAPLPAKEVQLDASRYVGSYRRVGLEIRIVEQDGRLTATTIPDSLLAIAAASMVYTLVPHNEDVLLMCPEGQETGAPMVFFDLDGQRYLHAGARTVARA